MNDDDSILPEHLSDEAAVQILDMLYDLIQALESRYCAQIMRYYQQNTRPSQPDLWD